jgi:hypothetical protein
MGPKTLSTIWGTYMKLVTKYQISAINSCWEKCDEKCAYMFNVYRNQLSQQTGSRNIEHICSIFVAFFSATIDGRNLIFGHKLHIGIAGIWRVQKRYPQYGIPIWCLWTNIRFLPSTVTEKNATKNILDGQRSCGQKLTFPSFVKFSTMYMYVMYRLLQ